MSPSNTEYPVIWLLTDNKAGHTSQSRGVAEALGLPFAPKHIEYGNFATLPNFLKGATLTGIDEKSDALAAPWPDLVIAAGRRLAPVARYIKKESGDKTKICQLMWPEGNVDDIDVLAVPEHDNQRDATITTIGAAHNVTSKKLSVEADKWQNSHDKLASPVITLLVGGDTKKGKFTPEMARDLAQKISKQVNKLGGSLLVTVSRRTSTDATRSLRNSLDCDNEFYQPQEGTDNPYFAYLGLADAVVVTGDSISMCTEATATAKPVFIFAPDSIVPKKHQRFHQSLFDGGYASEFTAFTTWDGTAQDVALPLNEAQRVADVLKKVL